MGEQTILCGMLQTGAILCFEKMVEKGIDAGYVPQCFAMPYPSPLLSFLPLTTQH
jgi:hypothetical protein